MSALYFLVITLVAFAVPLVALRRGREWLIALLPIYLITANVFASSFVVIYGVFTSFAIPIYAATFLITDMLSEHYSTKDARQAVFVGFMGQVLFGLTTLFMLYAPIDPKLTEIYSATFATLPRIIFGSFVAYVISQLLDIYIYHRIMENTGKERFLWVRNVSATGIAQLVDTVVFVTIAFAGTPGFEGIGALTEFILWVWAVKVLVAIIDTPYIYLSYRVLGLKTGGGLLKQGV
ncbi:MAG: queuosine precursor transporter [Flavobacteriales bacterium]|jgi:hypothetical protein|nr:queuosine precursor transporter [Flavobacteriales bacterium]